MPEDPIAMTSSYHLEPDQVKLNSLGNSLRCLSHISVLASIFLLVVNDHFMKHQYPSAITGKISDFAGLYFFPFLIALALSIVIENSGKNVRVVGFISFLIVGVLFTAIKTIPLVNSAMETLLSSLTGRSSIIVLDHSDLVALIILFPSWKLWNRKLAYKPTWFAWLVVCSASLASVATSCLEPSVITNLYVQDESIYAEAPEQYSWFASNDKGQSWQYLSEAPPELVDQLDREPVLPKMLCDPYALSRCFRVSGNRFVELSEDGGLTWDIAWEVPPSRGTVMDRLAGAGLCGKRIDLGPYDIEFIGDQENYRAVVAMGNEGVLLVDRDGEWSRVSVCGEATPTPFAAQDLGDLIALLLSETVFLIMIWFAVWILLNWLYWKPILRRLGELPTQDGGIKWILEPLRRSILVSLIVLIGIIMLEILSGIIFDLWFSVGRLSLLIAVPIIPLVGHIVSWGRLVSSVSNPKATSKGLKAIVLGTVSISVLGYAPLFLWAIGFIEKYEISLLVSVSLSIGALILAIVWVRSYASKTVEAMT